MSYEDLKNLEIKTNNLLIFIIIDIVYNLNNLSIKLLNQCLLIIILLIILINIFPIINHYIGGADIKIFLLLIPIIGNEVISLILISSFLGLLYSIIKQQKKIPFIPFINLGLIILEAKML
ncbi:MAG: prepilin peptidase [Mycoplasmatales bacterium]